MRMQTGAAGKKSWQSTLWEVWVAWDGIGTGRLRSFPTGGNKREFNPHSSIQDSHSKSSPLKFMLGSLSFSLSLSSGTKQATCTSATSFAWSEGSTIHPVHQDIFSRFPPSPRPLVYVSRRGKAVWVPWHEWQKRHTPAAGGLEGDNLDIDLAKTIKGDF